MFVNRHAVNKSLMRLFVLGLGAFLFNLAQTDRAMAIPALDLKPPMSWDDKLACELVIVGRYESHTNGVLALRVLRVLRGDGVKSNELVSVGLENRYSVETGSVGLEAMMPNAKSDGIPKLCYKTQVSIPGPLEPAKIIPDVREPAVYFFSKASASTLEREQQVQLATQTENWQQALDGKATPLIFRLAQPAWDRIQRDALEELFESRDRTTIHQLYDWASRSSLSMEPYSAAEILAAIGDKNGDVYDRGLELLTHPGQGVKKDDYVNLADILAHVTPDRAVDDFRRILAGDSTELQEAARSCLGFARTEKGLDLAFELLRETRSGHPEALSKLFSPATFPRPEISPSELARLKELARPRLVKAIEEALLTREQKKDLREQFEDMLDKPPTTAELAAAEDQLLHPAAHPSARGADGEEADKALAVIVSASDPRSIPTLVKVLRTHDGNWPGSAMVHFANISPHAMWRELVKQRVEARFGKETRIDEHYVYHHVMTILGTPHTFGELLALTGRRGQEEWLQKNEIPPAVREDVKKGTGFFTLSYRTFDAFSRVDPADVALSVDKALAERDKCGIVSRCELLSMGVKLGRTTLTNEFLESARQALAGQLTHDDRSHLADILFESGNKGAYRIYLQMIDQLGPTMWEHEHAELLARLLSSHAPDFFPRVLALLESQSLPVRQVGERALIMTFDWNFGFDATDFAWPRTEKLLQLKPLFERLSSMTAVQRRAEVLMQLGVKLNGPPRKAWLPVLMKAAVSFDPAVCANALQLIEDVTGEYDCLTLQDLSPGVRQRALSAFFQDRGIALGTD